MVQWWLHANDRYTQWYSCTDLDPVQVVHKLTLHLQVDFSNSNISPLDILKVVLVWICVYSLLRLFRDDENGLAATELSTGTLSCASLSTTMVRFEHMCDKQEVPSIGANMISLNSNGFNLSV